MSAVLPSILLLFDTSALLACRTRDWQLFSRIGDCYLPRVVSQEISFLRDRASETDTESAAREFERFYPTSGWRQTSSIASHPKLRPAEGHALSNRARVALAVAQTAYGLARNHPDSLVVLVANDQGLTQKVRSLELSNLCGIPLSALMQWLRTQRRPQAVNHQLQTMRLGVGEFTMVGAGHRYRSPAATAVAGTHATVTPTTLKPTRRSPVSQRSRRRLFNPMGLLSQLITLGIVITLGIAVWRVVNPISFNQFWQQLPLPRHQPSRR